MQRNKEVIMLKTICINTKLKFVLVFVGSVLFMIIGYYFAAAKELCIMKGYVMSEAFVYALKSPFLTQFNNYSALYMLAGVVIFEVITVIVVILLKKIYETGEEEEQDSDIVDLVNLEEINYVSKKEVISDSDLFGNKVTGQKSNNSSINENQYVSQTEIENNDNKESMSELKFDDDITNELLGEQYTLDQLIAMVEIKKYIKDVNADMLKKMFSREMSASDINSYIALFYE